MAEPLYATKDINKAIRAQIKKGATTRIEGLQGQHNIAVGLTKDTKVTMVGTAGDFFGALNSGVTLLIKGEAGRFLGDSMTAGKIIVDGKAGDGPGANMMGGKILIKGSAGSRVGVGMKGGAIIVNGDGGDLVGENLYGGDILITGDAGMGVGHNMMGGTIFVNGKINSLGKKTKLLRLNRDDRLKLTNILTEQNISGEFKFRKVVAENEISFSILKGLLGPSTETLKDSQSEDEGQV